MGVSKNMGTPKSSILIGFPIIFTIHFGVPLFLETPTSSFLPENLRLFKVTELVRRNAPMGEACGWWSDVGRFYRPSNSHLLKISTFYMCQGLNSHYFHIIGDKVINPIVGVYIPIIRIPSLKVV